MWPLQTRIETSERERDGAHERFVVADAARKRGHDIYVGVIRDAALSGLDTLNKYYEAGSYLHW